MKGILSFTYAAPAALPVSGYCHIGDAVAGKVFVFSFTAPPGTEINTDMLSALYKSGGMLLVGEAKTPMPALIMPQDERWCNIP